MSKRIPLLLLITACWLSCKEGGRQDAAVYGADSLRAEVQLERADSLLKTGEHAAARALLANALDNLRHPVWQGAAQAALGSYHINLGQYDSAGLVFREAFRLFEKAGYRGHAYVEARQQEIYLATAAGQYEKLHGAGLEMMTASLRLNDTGLIASSLLVMAQAAYVVNNFEQAIRFNLANIRLCRAGGFTSNIHRSYCDLAGAYNELGRHREALPAGYAALQHAAPDIGQDMYTTDFLADAHIGLGNYDSARHYLRISDSLTNLLEDPANKLNILSSLAVMEDRLKRHADALRWADSGLALSANISFTAFRPAFLQFRATALEGLGRYREALLAQRLGDSINNALSGEETKRRMAALEQQYQARQKQERIGQLEAHRTTDRRLMTLLVALLAFALLLGGMLLHQYRRQRRATALAASQAGRLASLMKEIHHRVKNNLQVVSSLISLRAGDLEAGPVQDMLTDIQGRIQSIALAHRQLYGSSQTEVAMEPYLRGLAATILALFTDPFSQELPQYIATAPGVSLDLDTAAPIGLMAAELLTNSCKHARQPGRKLEISIAMKPGGVDGSFEMTYRDNGPGLPEDYRQREGSIGMELVEMMARQAGGSVQHEHRDGLLINIRFMDAEARKARA